MTQDEIIELAKEAYLVEKITTFEELMQDEPEYVAELTKFAELILASQAQPTSQSSKIYNLYQYEIMDRTHVIRELISSSLLDNAGITPEQINLAEKALESLGALYQNAGNNFKDK